MIISHQGSWLVARENVPDEYGIRTLRLSKLSREPCLARRNIGLSWALALRRRASHMLCGCSNLLTLEPKKQARGKVTQTRCSHRMCNPGVKILIVKAFFFFFLNKATVTLSKTKLIPSVLDLSEGLLNTQTRTFIRPSLLTWGRQRTRVLKYRSQITQMIHDQ